MDRMKTEEKGRNIFSRFVLDHENDDPAKLLLAGRKWDGIDIDLAVNTIISRRKLRGKVPEWYSEPELVFPARISAEQCSSTQTAEYKASLALRLFHEFGTGSGRKDVRDRGMRIADLTGGLGVDSWAFSKVSGEVLYNEMNPVLTEAAAHNFHVLGTGNIRIRCKELKPGSLKEILSGRAEEPVSAVLDGRNRKGKTEPFIPDIVYLDPARRDSEGRKVFLLEDCSPDVLALEDELLDAAAYAIVKLSPMADMTMVMKRLGDRCRELHIVSCGGECKELLAVLDRNFHGDCLVSAVGEAGTESSGQGIFSFHMEDERRASARYISGVDEVRNSEYLFEPGKSLMKSGAFNLISSTFNITKLSRNTHLYFFSGEAVADRLCTLGKVFRILDVFPMTGCGIRKAGAEYPEAEVTARNIRMTSEQLRKKLGSRPDDRHHIFGAEYLIVTERRDVPGK